MAQALPGMLTMASAPPTPASSPETRPPVGETRPPVGFHGAVSDFKRRLIEATLSQAGGNRTHAARALGLQRTYLLRLMREFEVHIPPPPGPWRRASWSNGGNGASGMHGADGGGPIAPSQRH